ncbi:reticulon-4 isoform X2 [Pantherophis guttatus]|uniref:Reticulon n=1 Tax=Pantherophis guttatus TaxID=94885 RepID=A0A6P9CUT5_PANGU|nr:reticulon-4 isoform X2 [Pantherophis guttatus]
MDDPDQSPLVSSTTAASEQDRRQPQQPLFQYQFVRDPEDEDDEEEEDDDEELDDEQLEVRERKPAAAPTAPPAPTSSPPLVDRGASGEQPPSPPPFPQPAWATPPVVSTTTSPVAAASESAPKGEKEREPPRSAPLPPPHWEEPRAPAIPPRSAPLPPKREEPSVAKKGAAPGSPDETLFALPVASEPLMHSSADKGMDLQEQLGHACSARQEDFAAASLDATASLPSLSTLSVNPFKEYAALDTLSDELSAKHSYSPIGSDLFKLTTQTAQNPFLADDGNEFANIKPSYAADHSFCLFQTKEPLDTKIIPDTEELSASQQDFSLESPVELFVEQDKKERLEEGKHAIYDHGEDITLVDNHYSRDEYADLKPLELSWVSNESSNFKDVSENEIDNKLGSIADKYVKEAKTLSAHKVIEKENESSNEDISFPNTPEASKESSQPYITCTEFESSEKIESNMVTSLPLTEEKTYENKTDEKKIAEMMDQFGSTHIDLTSDQEQKVDSKKEEILLRKVSDTNVPEGLTPDLVQEAFESELHDVISPKLAYETKIDLVQTSESSQESLNVAVQLCPSFEGRSETSPSPILPDIVMEAPLTANSAVVGGPLVQLEISPFETFTAADEYENDYENVIQKSEKPPSYQEATNVPVTQAKEVMVEAAKKPDNENNPPLEDLDTSYISIACDLVKETKVSSEFTDYSKAEITEYVSQPVPEYSEHLEWTSLPSDKSYSFSGQPEINLVQKEEAVKGSLFETTTDIISNGGQKETYEEVQSSLSERYLESFQPQLETSKNEPTTWCLETEAAGLAKKEKTPQQHMEELGGYTDGFSVFKEPIVKEKIVLSVESSPEADGTVPYQVDKLMRSTEDILKENESKNPCEILQAELIPPAYQEVAQDLSLKNIHSKFEEQDLSLEKSSEDLDREVHEAAKEDFPPDVTPLASEKKVVNVRKGAESQDVSVKEKEKSLSMFSSKLSEPSVVDLLYWRDVKKTGVVFGASLFLLLSLTVFSIVSVIAYIGLALLSGTISFRIYKGVIQAVQKSDEGHPFSAYLKRDVAVSEELVQKYSHVVLGHLNSTIKELRRLFLVDDLVDSLKFAVLMWVFTYVGALFNGLTLLILALISLFSIPVIYEKHQTQIDHYVELVNKNVKDGMAKVQAKIPGLKRKTE